jgi:hypothetical protein
MIQLADSDTKVQKPSAHFVVLPDVPPKREVEPAPAPKTLLDHVICELTKVAARLERSSLGPPTPDQ